MFEANGRSLWVGAGEQYRTLKDAIAASHGGDTIFVRAGEYRNDYATIPHDLRIVGVDGMARLVNDQLIPNGKAMLITRADVVIENVEFSGAKVNNFNGAGIRYEGGDLTLRNTYFHHNQDGILGANDPNGRVLIENSEFAFNGTGDGQTHAIYFGKLANLTVRGTYIHDTIVGSHVKSRASETLIENSRLIDGTNGTSGYAVDVPNGGNVVIRNNVIEQGAKGVNQTIINLGGETDHPTGSLLMEGNQVSNARATSIGVYNRTDLDVTVRYNAFTALDKLIEGKGSSDSNYSKWTASQGSHKFIGSTNFDEVDYSGSPGAVTVDLAAGTRKGGFRGDDRMSNIDAVGGSNSNDKLYGDAAANWLSGNDGDDQLAGRAGNDVLQGGGGNDFTAGGLGDDIVRGGPGNDVVDGQEGNDLVFGDRGSDLVYGRDGEDVVQGNADSDSIYGGEGHDILRAGPDNDLVQGDGGNDTIGGDMGDDILIGGDGADVFIFIPGSGQDRILDFKAAEGDRLMLQPGMQWAVSSDGGSARFELGNGTGVTLVGVPAEQANASFILFG